MIRSRQAPASCALQLAAVLFTPPRVGSPVRFDVLERLDPAAAIADAGVLGGLFFIIAVAVAGLPPLSGFLGKFLLLRAALDHPLLSWIMTAVLIAGLLGLIALARTGSLLFFRALSPPAKASKPLPALLLEMAPIIGLLLLILGLTVAGGSIVEQTRAIAAQVLQPQLYINAVMHSGATP